MELQQRWGSVALWGPPGARASRGSRRLLGAVVLVLSALLAVALVRLAQTAIIRGLEAEAIETKAEGSETPLQFGVAFETVAVPVGQRSLDARIVHAANRRAPAVLIFHGNGEAVSDWSQAQARLFQAGVTSMVFDYGGFGNSPGRPTVQRMREDALAAYATWLRLTPEAESHVVIGHSLGNAVMLDAAPRLRPAPSGIVVHAGFTSAREFAVGSGMVSPWLAQLLPDLWDNAAALAPPGPAVLVVHGDRDEVIPARMGRQLADAAGSRSQWKMLVGVSHDQIYQRPSASDWDPILAFVDTFGPVNRRADALQLP